MRYLGRAIGVSFAAAAMLLTSAPASAAPTPAEKKPSPSPVRCTDHYTEARDGSTLTRTECGTATTSAPEYLPFNYTIDFAVRLRGRDMYRDSTGVFCNTFRSTNNPRPDLDPNIRITLYRNNSFGGDGKYETKTFPANGTSNSKCWAVVPNTGEPYYFQYEKGNNGFYIQGSGTAY